MCYYNNNLSLSPIPAARQKENGWMDILQPLSAHVWSYQGRGMPGLTIQKDDPTSSQTKAKKQLVTTTVKRYSFPHNI